MQSQQQISLNKPMISRFKVEEIVEDKADILNQINILDHEIFCIECKDRLSRSDYERIEYLHTSIMELKFKLYGDCK